MSDLLPYSMYYENSRGDILRLDQPPCVTTSCRLFDSSWRLTRAQRPLGEGGSLLARRRPADERTLTVSVTADTAAGLSRAMAYMADVFDYDVVSSTSGRLWINGSYMRCWCSGRVKELSCDIVNRAELTVSICPEQPAWCTETLYRIMAGETRTDALGHSYPYSYPYRYSSARGSFSLVNSHFSPSPMRITLYGPSSEPRVYVNGNCIGVNTPLLSGERVLIDQQNRIIRKTDIAGNTVSVFGDRIKNGLTFEYARPGSNPVDIYSDTLSADIVLIEERSEPLWVCA